MKALQRWWGEGGGHKEDPGRSMKGQPDTRDVTSTSPSVLVDKPILPLGFPYGFTCGSIVDGEDDPSAQAHALGVDNAGADQSRNGGIHG